MQDGYAHRADQLDLKEKELRAKEAELRKLETELRATGALRPEKNWPRCCPFTHHDIAGEVQLLCSILLTGTATAILDAVLGVPVRPAYTGPCTGLKQTALLWLEAHQLLFSHSAAAAVEAQGRATTFVVVSAHAACGVR